MARDGVDSRGFHAPLTWLDWRFPEGGNTIHPVMEQKTDYQRRLAESLIRSVGVEEAFYFALQNQWMGVLAHMPKPEAPRRPCGPAGPRAV